VSIDEKIQPVVERQEALHPGDGLYRANLELKLSAIQLQKASSVIESQVATEELIASQLDLEVRQKEAEATFEAARAAQEKAVNEAEKKAAEDEAGAEEEAAKGKADAEKAAAEATADAAKAQAVAAAEAAAAAAQRGARRQGRDGKGDHGRPVAAPQHHGRGNRRSGRRAASLRGPRPYRCHPSTHFGPVDVLGTGGIESA
jgi:hypothetical protein